MVGESAPGGGHHSGRDPGAVKMGTSIMWTYERLNSQGQFEYLLTCTSDILYSEKKRAAVHFVFISCLLPKGIFHTLKASLFWQPGFQLRKDSLQVCSDHGSVVTCFDQFPLELCSLGSNSDSPSNQLCDLRHCTIPPCVKVDCCEAPMR